MPNELDAPGSRPGEPLASGRITRILNVHVFDYAMSLEDILAALTSQGAGEENER